MLSSVLALALAASSPGSLDWQLVSHSSESTISGICRWGNSGDAPRYIVVHDNKKAGQARMSLLVHAASWTLSTVVVFDPQRLVTDSKGELLIRDLEGICPIPGKANEFLTVGNREGKEGFVFAFRLNADRKTAEVIGTAELPGMQPDFDLEGLDLIPAGNAVFAVWADRGGSNRPATIMAASVDLAKLSFGAPTSIKTTAPWPRDSDARSVSDLRISGSGEIYISSASDPGDEGPFDSAVYIAARFQASASGTLQLTPYSSLIPICYAPTHKIEAIDLDRKTGEIIFGTDDEASGASVAWFQR